MQRGLTLFETLVYLALFSFLIGGGFLAAYQIIEGSRHIAEKTVVEAEADFIFRKIDWALNGEIDSVSGSPGVLHIVKDGVVIEFEEDTGILNLDGDALTSPQLAISNFDVTVVSSFGNVPEAVEVSFTINGKEFGPTKRYIR